MDLVQRAINKTIRELKAKYEVIGEGHNRIVFLKDDDTVIKCPLNEDGLNDNISESRRYRQFGDADVVKYAQCKMFFLNDINCLEMERVYPITNEETPEWADFVDCGQIGKNKDGKILAYDYA